MSSDPRFAKLKSDPRFVRPKAAKNKLVLDERFAGLFAGDAASKKGPRVDKYGRKRGKDETENELKRYYRMEEKEEDEAAQEGEEVERNEEEGSEDDEEDEEEEDDDEDDEPKEKTVDFARGEGLIESSSEEEEDSDGDSDDSDGPVTLAPATLIRRQSRSPSIDLSETEPVFEDDDNDEQGDEDDEDYAQEASRRVAVVNMDWDHLRAVDLFRVLASPLSLVAPEAPRPSYMKKKTFDDEGEDRLKGTGKLQIIKGRLLKLVIYQSSFGKERIEREEREGPPKELFLAKDGDDDDEDGTMRLGRLKSKLKKRSSRKKRRGDDEDSDDESEEELTEMDLIREQVADGQDDYDTEALRRYQLERLRYYYAIATFDSPASAEHVVTQINGTEFERTANVFDLQYVTDDVTFNDSPIHDEATEATIAAQGTSYEGVEFVTDALRHSKVQLTWDADDPHRKNKISSFLSSATDSKTKGAKGKGRELNEEDIKVYLASSSDEDGEEEEEVEEADDFFETEKAGDKKGQGKREKLRSLFGLDSGAAAETTWDGGKQSRKEGEMQITFAPALSEFAETSDKKSRDSKDDETALETYKRKEKERRARKQAERKARKQGIKLAPEGEEGPEFGGEDVGPGGFDDDFFKNDGDGDVWDGNRDFEAGDTAAKKGGKLSKKQKRDAKIAEQAAREVGQAELALLVDDDDEGGEDGSKHFDMRKILKAERNKAKKARRGKGKNAEKEEVVKDDFQIDVKDDRFKALHEDYEFAIDPSNPRYQKSRNMTALLAEGQKRRSNKRESRAPVGAPSGKPAPKAADDEESLRRLVESVKRKSGDVGGRGKRAKVDA